MLHVYITFEKLILDICPDRFLWSCQYWYDTDSSVYFTVSSDYVFKMDSKHPHWMHKCRLILICNKGFFLIFIMKTYLYNFDPLKPHYYIHVVNWGLQGYTLFFLFLLKNIDCGYCRGSSNEYPQSIFWAEIWKIPEFLSENFQFLVVKFSIYLNRHVFIMLRLIVFGVFIWLLFLSESLYVYCSSFACLFSDSVVRTSYYKYFHPKECLISNGVLNR